jgi:hypothetical protein
MSPRDLSSESAPEAPKGRKPIARGLSPVSEESKEWKILSPGGATVPGAEAPGYTRSPLRGSGNRLFVVLLCAAGMVSCGKSALSPELATLGDTEVTAKLTSIGGDFPPNKLYDYMYVMKYHVLKVHRGKVEGEDIFVGHYNPLKPRAAAEDKYSGKVGGNVDRFQVGDVHRMALEAPLDELFMGGIIDKHIKEKGTRYRAIWTDRASE